MIVYWRFKLIDKENIEISLVKRDVMNTNHQHGAQVNDETRKIFFFPEKIPTIYKQVMEFWKSR